MTLYFALPRDFPLYDLAGLLLVPFRVSGTVFLTLFFFLNFIYVFTFWLSHSACRVLATPPPPPGVKPRTLTVKVGVLTGGLEVHTEPRLVTVSAFAVPST